MAFNPFNQGVYNSTPPTLTSGQESQEQLDVNGNVKVAVQGTSPVSAASLPLPSGASTAVKQPALGTAGSASTDVITVQGVASMTALKVDGSAVTQPVSGTVAISGNPADNVAEWGGTAVAAPLTAGSVAGTEAGPVTRPIQRKYSQILSTTPLAASAVYDSSSAIAWFDSNADGTSFVQAVALPGSISSATNGFQIIQTNDTSNASVFNTAAQTSVGSSSLPVILNAQITMRYWKVRYANGATLQTSFELAVTASCLPQAVGVSGTGAFAGSGVTIANAVPVGLLANNVVADGVAAQALMLSNGVGGVMGAVGMAVTNGSNGSTVMLRCPNIFKNIAAVAVTAGTPQTIWTPASGKKFRIMGWALSLTVAGSVLLKDTTAATELMRTPLMAAGIGIVSPEFGNGILAAAANDVLGIDVTASGSVSGFVFGTEE